MKLRMGDKAKRILTFLMALTDGSIAAAMQAHGMTQEDLDEGWDLLHALGRRKLSEVVSPIELSLRQQVDEWENYWYPIIDAVLRRHYPQVHEVVFLNLPQADITEVVVSVATLLERLDALKDPRGPLGEAGPDALKMLARRKVDEQVLGQARALLTELRQFKPTDAARSEQEWQMQLEAAEAEVWGWYLEWSRIARVAIKSRRLLRKLGYLSADGRVVDPDTEVLASEGSEGAEQEEMTPA